MARVERSIRITECGLRIFVLKGLGCGRPQLTLLPVHPPHTAPVLHGLFEQFADEVPQVDGAPAAMARCNSVVVGLRELRMLLGNPTLLRTVDWSKLRLRLELDELGLLLVWVGHLVVNQAGSHKEVVVHMRGSCGESGRAVAQQLIVRN